VNTSSNEPALSQSNGARRQYFIWGAIVVVILACIGSATYLLGSFTGSFVGATPTPTPTNTPLPPPVVNIQEITAQAQLVTVEIGTVTEIYNETAAQGWLDEFLGNRERLLMLVYGDVKAGFDLSKLSEDDLWSEGTRVRLVLPAPEILATTIDFERTHIVFYEDALLLDETNPNIQGEALKQAQEAIEQAALEEGALERANEYGKLYFENFLYDLGFTDVEVVVDAQIFKK
jgi:hypothetical protein